ncbi:MAG: FAD-binding oxidoreductase [Mailhella sp.]|nr:FAD-binding oxidoreductase [Mailhella sp.]
MKSSEYDVIVIGCGVAGAAVAYGLSGKHQKVLVLDAPTTTNRASRANVGLIWCQSKFLHLPEYARWGFISSSLYPELTRELEEVSGIKIPVNYQGGLIPVLSEEEYQAKYDYIEKLRVALGEYDGSMISRAELEKLLPNIAWGEEVCGAAWCANDGVIDPLTLLSCLVSGDGWLDLFAMSFSQRCCIMPVSILCKSFFHQAYFFPLWDKKLMEFS